MNVGCSLWFDFFEISDPGCDKNTKCRPVTQRDFRRPSLSSLFWCLTASGFWDCLLFSFFLFFLLFDFSDGRWADANGEQVLRSLPPPHEKLSVVGSEWTDCNAPACPSLWLPFFFLCYLLNASLHISLCCRRYRTLPSHLINHSIELDATQQKPVGSESEVICLPLSFPTPPPHHLLPCFFFRRDCNSRAGSFVMIQVFCCTHCLIGFIEGPSLSPHACLCAIRSGINGRARRPPVMEQACKSEAAEGCVSSPKRWMD